MSERSYFGFRLAILLFAMLLGVQCVWLLLAEFSRPDIYRLPTDAATATAAPNERINAGRAAMIFAIRGDLWAESTFTYADLMWGDGRGGTDPCSHVHL